MENDKSLVRDCLEMALGATIVAVVTPFVFTNLLLDKLENIVKLVKQMQSSHLD